MPKYVKVIQGRNERNSGTEVIIDTTKINKIEFTKDSLGDYYRIHMNVPSGSLYVYIKDMEPIWNAIGMRL